MWTFATAIYGLSLLMVAAHHTHSAVLSLRSHGVSRAQPKGGARTYLLSLVRTGFEEVAPVLLPLLLLGPLVFLGQWLPGSVVQGGFLVAVGAGFVLWLLPKMREGLRWLTRVISLPAFLVAFAGWEFCGVVIAIEMGWPVPREGVFGLLTGVNATLFVAAALVFGVPRAWRSASLTYYASGLFVMVAGLLAAIAGALRTGNPHLLFALAMAPVVPVVVAFLVKAHGKLGAVDGLAAHDATGTEIRHRHRTARYSRASRSGETPAT
jgi:hypothetical protein